ncbi:response regulator [candidate division WOR-3 bacterium]|nr:response regulator [candidate division WOR-3 bacterium]
MYNTKRTVSNTNNEIPPIGWINHYSAIIENFKEAIVLCSNDKIIMANSIAVSLFNANNSNELLGKSILNFIKPYKDSIVIKKNKSNGNGEKVNKYRAELSDIKGFITDVNIAEMEVNIKEKNIIQYFITTHKDMKNIESGVKNSVKDVKNFEELLISYEDKLKKNIQIRNLMSSLLDKSNKNIPIEDKLNNALEEITSIKWLFTEKKGAIFLENGKIGYILLKGSIGLTDIEKDMYSKISIDQFICSDVIFLGKIEYKDDLECYNSDIVRNKERIGNCCIPIIRLGKTIGVMLANVKRGKDCYDNEEYLKNISDIIAQIIWNNKLKREKDILEEEFIQAQKMESIGHMVGAVAHDFNNMLAGIMGNAELLSNKLQNNNDLKDLSENILKISESAAKYSRQLLDFSRRGSYQMEALNLNKIIMDVISMLKRTLNMKIEIENNFKINPIIQGNATHLMNAFLNLGINAIDAMPKGGKIIFTTELVNIDESMINKLRLDIDPGMYVEISINDTGVGMNEKTKKHLFEPFFTTKKQGKGTGLGLASVHSCIVKHSGAIRVESKPGSGTTMIINLPLLEDYSMDEFLQSLNKTKRGIGSILFVDDEEMIRNVASEILISLGYQVFTCTNGQEAIEYYSENHLKVDLVILDMIMPKMSGSETFIKLKEIDSNVKVLLSTGSNYCKETKKLIEAGVKGVIQKPYRISELSEKIKEFI